MELNSHIDHTLLRPTATAADIENLCREAVEYRFFGVVTNPVFAAQVAENLKGTGIKTCSVIAFPLGGNLTETKVAEAKQVEAAGAEEIDVVANIGWIQEERFAEVASELAEIRRILSPGTVMKVIIETPAVRPEKWKGAVEAVIQSGADFVKSATGFFGPTPVEHIRQLYALADKRIKIKAAGGIKTAAQAISMIEAGALRLGSSSSVAIMKDFLQSANK